MPEGLLGIPLLLCVSALVVGGASALLPLAPIEPLLLGASAAVPAPLLFPAVAMATVGHMGAKTLLYLGSRRAAEYALPPRRREALERVRALLSRTRRAQLVTLLVSAVAGVPPFYAVTVCYGVLRLPLRDFLIVGLVGRAIRFGALALLPRLFGAE